MRLLRLLVATASLLAIAAGAWSLHDATTGLTITATTVDGTPVTIFRPANPTPAPLPTPAPVIVIAHGFAGSQQLMQPFAVTLARNGYLAVTFDFPGHGRNPTPLHGGIADEAALSLQLQNALTAIIAAARTLPGSDGRIALLGHSMATDIVVRAAEQNPAIAATVAVSLFSPAVTAQAPRNLLIIDGALEPAMLTDEAFRAVALAAGGPARERVTYGSFADGTARRLALAGGVEHIGVLYSAQSLSEALAWFNQAFDRQSSGFIDAPGPAIGLLFAGLIALAWPLTRLLPILAPTPQGAGLPWRRLLLPALAPAILTPLILWILPTGFLPLLLGDYLTLHFALYGALTLLALAIARAQPPRRIPWAPLAVAAVAVAAYEIAALGLPIDTWLTSFVPTGARLALLPAVLSGTLIYFLADEWLTRGPAVGGYAFTKLLFVISLAIAVALNPEKLFFLIIITPVILIFLTIYGLFSTWTYRRTRHPTPAALANALALASAITATFPLISR